VSATLLESSQGLGELSALVLVFVLLRGFVFSSPFGMIPACSFYSLKKVQGYNNVGTRCDLAGWGARKPLKDLIWWRHDRYGGGMASVVLALLLRVRYGHHC
jgi:hypothetical protein